MKKLLVVLAVFLGIVSVSNYAGAIEVSFENLTWFDYDAFFNGSLAITKGGQFSVGREYLTFKANYNDVIKARVTLDMANSVAAVSNNGALDKYIKYAYADFKVADPFVVTAGLQKTYFGILPEWEYPLPLKEYAESSKILSSADLGIGFSGTLLNKMLVYHLQVLNGEGYATWYVKNDSCFEGMADLRFAYMKDNFAGLSYIYYDNGENASTFNHAFAVYDISKLGPLSLMLQYTGSMTNGGAITSLLEAFVGFKVSDAFTPMAMFNMTLGKNPTIGLGANIVPVRKIIIKPYVAMTLDDPNTTKNELGFEFKTQMEMKFDFKVGTPDGTPAAAPVTAAPAPAPAPVQQ